MTHSHPDWVHEHDRLMRLLDEREGEIARLRAEIERLERESKRLAELATEKLTRGADW